MCNNVSQIQSNLPRGNIYYKVPAHQRSYWQLSLDQKKITIITTVKPRCFLLVDECVGHEAQLLNLSALLLSQVLHGLLGVQAGPGGAVAVDLPLVLPWLQRALERLVGEKTAKDLGPSRLSTPISCAFVPFQHRHEASDTWFKLVLQVLCVCVDKN